MGRRHRGRDDGTKEKEPQPPPVKQERTTPEKRDDSLKDQSSRKRKRDDVPHCESNGTKKRTNVKSETLPTPTNSGQPSQSGSNDPTVFQVVEDQVKLEDTGSRNRSGNDTTKNDDTSFSPASAPAARTPTLSHEPSALNETVQETVNTSSRHGRGRRSGHDVNENGPNNVNTGSAPEQVSIVQSKSESQPTSIPVQVPVRPPIPVVSTPTVNSPSPQASTTRQNVKSEPVNKDEFDVRGKVIKRDPDGPMDDPKALPLVNGTSGTDLLSPLVTSAASYSTSPLTQPYVKTPKIKPDPDASPRKTDEYGGNNEDEGDVTILPPPIKPVPVLVTLSPTREPDDTPPPACLQDQNRSRAGDSSVQEHSGLLEQPMPSSGKSAIDNLEPSQGPDSHQMEIEEPGVVVVHGVNSTAEPEQEQPINQINSNKNRSIREQEQETGNADPRLCSGSRKRTLSSPTLESEPAATNSEDLDSTQILNGGQIPSSPPQHRFETVPEPMEMAESDVEDEDTLPLPVRTGERPSRNRRNRPVATSTDSRHHDNHESGANSDSEDILPIVPLPFNLTTNPIPNVQPVRKVNLEVQADSEEEQEPSSGPVEAEMKKEDIPQPIVYHTDQKDDDDQEDQDEPGGSNGLHGQRYFKQKGVREKYDFKYFKFPDIKNLAVYQYKDMILEAVVKHHVIVVEGFTGCGKTTQVPQFILDYCVENGQACDIVVTQPRKLATTSVARRVCNERGWDLGGVVGYQVGMDTQHRRETMVTYMTTGVLLQQLIGSKSLRRWTHIIIDEVHERDLPTDFLLLVIKKILMEDKAGQERHVKIVLMSATLNAQKFSQYFSIKRHIDAEVELAPIVKIPLSQKKFEVVEAFLHDLMDSGNIKELEFSLEKAVLHPEILDAGVNTILSLDQAERAESNDPRVQKGKVHAQKTLETRGSVLCFLPGLQEIEGLHKRLDAECKRDGRDHKWNIVPLHSTISGEDQNKAFQDPQPGYRKIILATNIAESSITVPDIVYVVDFCLTKSQNTDPRTNFSCLRTVWASMSQCIQRKGRTGRVAKGKVFRLVPKDFFATFEKDTKPEMMRAGLEGVIVKVKSLGLGSPKELLGHGLDIPSFAGIERAVVNLKELGGLSLMVTEEDGSRRYDTCDGDLTFLGHLMNDLPIPPQLVRLIMLGHALCVLKEAIVIAAGLSVKSPFNTPYRQKLQAYLQKTETSQKSYSDCVAILLLYDEWRNKHDGQSNPQAERSWARTKHVQISGLRDMKELVFDLEKRLDKKGVRPVAYPMRRTQRPGEVYTKEQLATIKFAIAGAFYPNYFHRQRPGTGYERELLREVMGNDLFNTVYYKGFTGGHCKHLYGGIVAEKLAFGSGIPKVTFDGQKCLVEFDHTTGQIGPISKSIYQAVKLRQLRERTELYVLPREREPDYFTQQVRILESMEQHYTKCPTQVGLPPIHTAEINCIITHIESPSRFWIVYKWNEQKLNSMSIAINRNMQPYQRIPLQQSQIGPGAFCLAPYAADGRNDFYYRARIRTVTPGKREAWVYFVDHGNSQKVDTCQLYGFNEEHRNEDLLTDRCLAVECRLAKIKPAAIYGSVWHEGTIGNFSRFADSHNLRLQVYCVVKNVVAGVLFGTPYGSPEGVRSNVNKKLIDEGFAEVVEENMDCENNALSRERYPMMKRGNDNAQIEACNLAQILPIKDITYPVPPRNAPIRIELKGPFSPLELSFVSLCHSSNSREVSLDDNSVNSVALDQEPAKPVTRLVVAASVSIQDKSGRVVARDTTMMPARPGLLSLIAMTFAPKIELRVDRQQSQYTGVLCGLGMDYHTQLPIYQDHDMEIIFHTTIDDDDIQRINTIRHSLSLILRGPEYQNLNAEAAHHNVVKAMFALFGKKRDPLEEEIWPRDTYSWNKLPPESIIPPRPESTPRLPTDIFSPHDTVQLKEYQEQYVSWGDFAI